jgi:hypothetical protein
MERIQSGQSEDDGRLALVHMEQALALLDRADCALSVSAHLDLAICRLRDMLPAQSAAPGNPSSLTAAAG